MKKPQSPPEPLTADALSEKETAMLSEKNVKIATEFNSKYLHWDEVRRRDTEGTDPEIIWSIMQIQRQWKMTSLDIGGIDIRYSVIDEFQRSLHRIDMMSNDIHFSDKSSKVYAVSSMMEESIASSQLEGAVTTTRVAKTMLREGRRPKDTSERMIFNNYNAMRYIKDRKDDPLTPKLILNIHRIITNGVLEDVRFEGEFRTTDDIVVQDKLSGDIFHEPPAPERIPEMIDALCEYVNFEDSTHPVIKGIVMHFLTAYIHPFVDGNGRLARSLLYWYALKKGYRMFEFLAVSRIIKEHRGRYDMSYLLSETDGNDITYFIRYNLKCIEEAMDAFTEYIERKNIGHQDARSINEHPDLNLRQRSILNDAMNGEVFSIYEVRSKYQVSYQTAASDIYKMESLGLIERRGKEWNKVLFAYADKK